MLLWGHRTNRPITGLSHPIPTEVKCRDQEVRPSFNGYAYEAPPHPGHTAGVEISRDGWPSEQTNEEITRGSGGEGRVCLVLSASGGISPPLPCCVWAALLIRPVSADTQHTVAQPRVARSPLASQLLSVCAGRVRGGWTKKEKKKKRNADKT